MSKYTEWALDVVLSEGLTTGSHVDAIAGALFEAILDAWPRMDEYDAAEEAERLARRIAA